MTAIKSQKHSLEHLTQLTSSLQFGSMVFKWEKEEGKREASLKPSNPADKTLSHLH